jgi:hypothetical protein
MESFTLTNYFPRERSGGRKQSLEGVQRLRQICFPCKENLNNSSFDNKNLADSLLTGSQLKLKDLFEEHHRNNRSFSYNAKPKHKREKSGQTNMNNFSVLEGVFSEKDDQERLMLTANKTPTQRFVKKTNRTTVMPEYKKS